MVIASGIYIGTGVLVLIIVIVLLFLLFGRGRF
jgi:hypothetical protein